jgi:hypothetical protein
MNSSLINKDVIIQRRVAGCAVALLFDLIDVLLKKIPCLDDRGF